ncbi:MAG: VWA domain-containing protein, partial [Acidobacteriota bacterium]
AVLDRALERHPGVERFKLMLAELDRLETRKPSRRSAEIVRRAVDGALANNGTLARPGAEELTPRVRYLRLPDADWDDNAGRVEAWLTEDRPLLAAAIAEHDGPRASRWCGGLLRDFYPRRVDAEPSPEVAERATDAPPRTEANDSAPHQAIDPAVAPQGPASAGVIPVGAGALVEPGPEEAARAALDDRAQAEAAEARAALRRGYYVDPNTGERVRIDMALDLPLRQIYVTPSRFGRRGVAVEPGEVELFDDGVRQDIVTFEQGDTPFTATVLIDASGSMEGSRLARALAGAQRFIGGMASHDRTRLLVASDRLRQATPLLAAQGDLRRHLRQHAAGGTALFDHLFLAVDALAPEQGRKVVVVLSDGYDLASAVPVESIAAALKRSQIQLYWVRLRDPRAVRRDFTPPTGWRSTGDTRRELDRLEEAIEASGGRVVAISRFLDVSTAFAEILDELRRQIA